MSILISKLISNDKQTMITAICAMDGDSWLLTSNSDLTWDIVAHDVTIQFFALCYTRAQFDGKPRFCSPENIKTMRENIGKLSDVEMATQRNPFGIRDFNMQEAVFIAIRNGGLAITIPATQFSACIEIARGLTDEFLANSGCAVGRTSGGTEYLVPI